MRTAALFGAKNLGFFEIYVVPHGQGESGSIFRDFVRSSFMDDGPYRSCTRLVNNTW